jgi:hypothetical protein
VVFDSLWKSFGFRFQSILKGLSRYEQLLTKELTPRGIIAEQEWKIKAQEEIFRQEKRTQDFYLHDSLAWLKLADEQQDDELERLSSKRHKGTCQWILKNHLFQNWKEDRNSGQILWVKGIPGAGEISLL